MAVLRADAGIVQTRSNRMHRRGGTVGFLQVIAVEAVQIAEFAQGHGGGVAAGFVEAFTGRFYAHQCYLFIVDKRVKQTQRIRAAAHAGDDFVGQAAVLLLELLARFMADDGLEIRHHFGIGRRADHRADGKHAVAQLPHIRCKCTVHRFFQCTRTGRHRHDFRAQNLHARYIRMFFGNIDHAHVDFAFQAQQGRSGGQGHAVLPRAGFGNHFFLAQFFRQQHFADAVVDFVRTGVV